MKIKSVTSLGIQDTYDLEMTSEYHNYFANDIIVSNSHSVAYSVISVWTMYLKMHFPLEFYAALLETMKEEKKIMRIISEYKKNSLNEDWNHILPIDINKSFETFSIDADDNEIRTWFSEIKGVGQKASSAIVEERTKNWPYNSFQDFMDRIDKRRVNKGTRKKLCIVWVFNSIWGYYLENEDIQDIKKELINKGYRLKVKETGQEIPFENKRVKNPKKINKEELEELIWDLDMQSLIIEKEEEIEEQEEIKKQIEDEFEQNLVGDEEEDNEEE